MIVCLLRLHIYLCADSLSLLVDFVVCDKVGFYVFPCSEFVFFVGKNGKQLDLLFVQFLQCCRFVLRSFISATVLYWFQFQLVFSRYILIGTCIRKRLLKRLVDYK